MRQLKILIVSPKLVVGGEERDLVDLIKNLDRSKFSLSLCVFESKGWLISEVPKDVCIFNLGKKNRWDLWKLVLRLSRVIDEVKPDIVLSSLWYSTAAVAASKIFNRHKFKILAREPHNHKQDCPGTNFMDRFRRFLMDFAHKRADCVITPSRGTSEDIARSYGLPPQKVTYIYNSVDASKIVNMASKNRRKFKNRVVTLGRLIPRKGFDSLIRSFGKVKAEIRDAELVIIGEGIEREGLERMAKELGLADSVKITGFLENPYVEIASSDVFICSSLWEGFGKVIIEAMVCGTPVVSTRCNFGPEEIITDGVDGLLVPVGDEASMAQAVIRLLKDESLNRQISEAGFRRAGDFSIEKNVIEYEKIFRKVVGAI